jgi:hypothetical protein
MFCSSVLTCLYLFQENHEQDIVMTNDDVLGDEIPRDQQDALRHFCYQTLKLGAGVGSSNNSLQLLMFVVFTFSYIE